MWREKWVFERFITAGAKRRRRCSILVFPCIDKEQNGHLILTKNKEKKNF